MKLLMMSLIGTLGLVDSEDANLFIGITPRE